MTGLLSSIDLHAQSLGLCDPANRPSGAVEGGFDIKDNILAGCSPFALEVVDKSGGSHLNYYFDYKGESYNYLPNSYTSKTGTIIENSKARVATILQYGEKNGKPLYACKQVYVRPDDRPIFSYFNCDTERLEISIPDTDYNNFDYYLIDWGDGSNVERIDKLPFNKVKSILPTHSGYIKVSGKYNNTALNCRPAPPIKLLQKIANQYPNGYDDDNKVNIDKLYLKTPNTVEISWHGAYTDPATPVSNSSISTYYSLYQRESTNRDYKYFAIAATEKKITPGTMTVNLPDPSKSYCFIIARTNSCGWDYSSEICTVPLGEIQSNGSENHLEWSGFKNSTYTINSSDNTDINSKLDFVIIENGIETTESISADLLNKIDVQKNCAMKVCYRIERTTFGKIHNYNFKGVSVSSTRCIDRSSIQLPPINSLFTTVNDDNSIKIDLQEGAIKAKEYFLYHQTLNGYDQIRKITNEGEFIVNGLMPENASQCFKVGFEDICGSRSELSDEVCTIFLSNEDETLNWTLESPFVKEKPDEYTIEQVLPEVKYIAKSKTSSYKTNVTNQDEDLVYRISLVDKNGNISYSNRLAIKSETRIFIPNSFSPNNDGHNDIFRIVGAFKRFKSFDLRLFDRWGKELIQFNKPDFTWDGTINTKVLSSGQYRIKIKGIVDNGTPYFYEGGLWLLR